MLRGKRLSPGLGEWPVFGLAAALTVAACASPSPINYYQPLSTNGRYGHFEEVLGATRYAVSYLTPTKSSRSVSNDTREREGSARIALAYDMALWRSCELALGAGYPAFEVLLRENDLRVDRNWYAYGDPFYDPWFPRYHRWHRPYPYPYSPFPPDPYFDRYTRLSARVTLTVEFQERPGTDAIDAASTLGRIKTKYQPAAASTQPSEDGNESSILWDSGGPEGSP